MRVRRQLPIQSTGPRLSAARLLGVLAATVAIFVAGLAMLPAGATYSPDGGYMYDAGARAAGAAVTNSVDGARDAGDQGVAAVGGALAEVRLSAGFVAPRSTPRVSEPMIRDAMTDVPLQSQQGAVSLPKVQSAVDQLAAGSPAPPIRVDGSIIVDGNHRYIAGQIMDDVPAIQPWPGGNSGRVVPWWEQVIDPTDWGG